jgi:hypothetical protein
VVGACAAAGCAKVTKPAPRQANSTAKQDFEEYFEEYSVSRDNSISNALPVSGRVGSEQNSSSDEQRPSIAEKTACF